jgi:hypothetical protein
MVWKQSWATDDHEMSALRGPAAVRRNLADRHVERQRTGGIALGT